MKKLLSLYATLLALFISSNNLLAQEKQPVLKNVYDTVQIDSAGGLWTFKKTDLLRINVVRMQGVTKLHKHPDAEHTILLLKGEMIAEVDGQKIPLKEGDMLSIPIGVPHKYYVKGKQAIITSMDAPYYDPKKTIILE